MTVKSWYHRSDWPEVGLSKTFVEGRLPPLAPRSASATEWVQMTQAGNLAVRWLAAQDLFESRLYGFPVWGFRVEAGCDDDEPQRDVSSRLQGHLAVELDRLLAAPPWGSGYVCSKVVSGEPLHQTLSRFGFAQIEHRRLYKTPVGQFSSASAADFKSDLRYTSLAEVAPERQPRYRDQILDICREAFGQRGFSRHFTDPFLLERRPGLEYILAVMQLNFDRLPPAGFLIAVDSDTERVAGFSVFGEKPGLTGATHTQLLSAVRGGYRGRGVYGGLTRLLWQSLPRDATLLNVTHVDNREMQNAYDKSGRVRFADTLVVRRVFLPGNIR